MSTVEDFRNAPVGATATNSDGGRAMRMDYLGRRWILPNGFCLDDEEMKRRDYTLDRSAPTTAQEALDLAWELAHPIREGQVIPAGTVYLVSRNGERPATMRTNLDQFASKADETNRRTLEPLSDPEPDWLDAPAVLATCGCRGIELWHPNESKDGLWVSSDRGEYALWSTLRDVTPLYPKGQEA